MTAVAPRPVFCVIDHDHRDLAVAREVCAGRFDLAGTEVALGLAPRWMTADFPDDDEWRIELSKFYYGLDLAHAYAESGDRGFVDAWFDLVSSWIAVVPVDHDPTDVIARRIQNWTYAWNRLDRAAVDEPALNSQQAELILSSIGAQIDYLRDHLATERNHRTLELYALFVCALAYPSLAPDDQLARYAAFELYRNLRADVLADGVHRERSTHYHAIALRSFLGARVNAARFGIDLPADYDERLGAACEFLAHILRPDGSLPQLSDSDDGDYGDLLRLAAGELDRPDFEWVGSTGKHGTPPTTRAAAFANGGYYVQRSGWGDGDTRYEDERQLIFDCGPVGDSGHGHYDALHLEVSAGGQPLLVDPGRFTYAEDGCNWRRHFKGTAAHNTVCVDGLDQIPYRRGKPKGPMSQTQVLERTEAPGVASIVGEVVSPNYDAIHRRRVLFVNEEWWIVEDRLQAHESHRYDLRFHLPASAEGRADKIGPGVLDCPGFRLLFTADPAPVATIEPGWVAPSYGRREPAPVVSISTTATDARFLTVVWPTSAGTAPPTISSSGNTHLELQHDSLTERVEWGVDGVRWQRW